MTPEEKKEKKRAYNAAYKKGHSAELRAQRAVYVKAHSAEIRAYHAAYNAAYYKSHRAEKRVYNAAYREANPVEIRAGKAAYHMAHPENGRAWTKAYQKAHPAEIRARNSKRRALQLGATVDSWTVAQEEAHIDRLGRRCVYCGVHWVRGLKTGHLDHVVPLSRGGTHALSNMVPACPPCNTSKNDKLLSEWSSRAMVANVYQPSELED